MSQTNSATDWIESAATKVLLKHYQEAIIDHTMAIRLKPDYAEAYYNRGFAKKSHERLLFINRN